MSSKRKCEEIENNEAGDKMVDVVAHGKRKQRRVEDNKESKVDDPSCAAGEPTPTIITDSECILPYYDPSFASKQMNIDDFIDITEIGCGTFSTVYKAWSVSQNLDVALKKINLQDSENKIFTRKELLTEGLVQHQLDHVNISKLLGFYETPPYIVYVMEFYDNGDLFNYIHQKEKEGQRIVKVFPTTHERNVNYLRQLVEAVQYMHRTIKYVHNDIKPENIQVTLEEVVKLGDFGGAVPMENERELHNVKVAGGTYDYMPPESLSPPKKFDSTVDVWSIGVIAFEMWADLRTNPFFYDLNQNPSLKKHVNLGVKRMKEFINTGVIGKKRKAEYDNMPPEVKLFIQNTIGKNREERLLASQLLDTPLLITKNEVEE